MGDTEGAEGEGVQGKFVKWRWRLKREERDRDDNGKQKGRGAALKGVTKCKREAERAK